MNTLDHIDQRSPDRAWVSAEPPVECATHMLRAMSEGGLLLVRRATGWNVLPAVIAEDDPETVLWAGARHSFIAAAKRGMLEARSTSLRLSTFTLSREGRAFVKAQYDEVDRLRAQVREMSAAVMEPGVFADDVFEGDQPDFVTLVVGRLRRDFRNVVTVEALRSWMKRETATDGGRSRIADLIEEARHRGWMIATVGSGYRLVERKPGDPREAIGLAFPYTEPLPHEVGQVKCCNQCGDEKTLDAFPMRTDRGDPKRTNECRQCKGEIARGERQRQQVDRYTNRHGLRGVHEVGGRFQSRITVGGVTRSLGLFATAEAAHQAYADERERIAAAR